MIPQNYAAWKLCITRDCKIKLTQNFVNMRLGVYSDPAHPQTIKFIKLYGTAHHQKILQWFRQASLEIENSVHF